MDNSEIEDYINKLDKDTHDIKKNLFSLCWYMRGSISLEEAYQLDWQSREIIYNIIEENLETTKKSGLPFF